SVTIHKILHTKENFNNSKFPGTEGLDGKKYDGTQIGDITGFFGQNSKEIKDVFFALKVKGGNYVKKGADALTPKTPMETTTDINEAVGGLTTGSGLKFNTEGLKGEFQIVEVSEKTTYKGDQGEVLAGRKAVPLDITLPLINETGLVQEAHVYPKNTQEKPEVTKEFGQEAGRQDTKSDRDYTVGEEIPYVVTTTIPEHARYQTLTWTDTMSKGLVYIKGTMEVKLNNVKLEARDYDLVEKLDGFILNLTGDGIKKVEAGNAAEQTITLEYKG
ncbi:pilin N-terminal domain-containing protein, partial [Histophilus somni]|uniref:pilin N-terminal domain-containing protein n=1 Tax=Histophilus somni TaxID=731 RepID=UPI00201F9893